MTNLMRTISPGGDNLNIMGYCGLRIFDIVLPKIYTNLRISAFFNCIVIRIVVKTPNSPIYIAHYVSRR